MNALSTRGRDALLALATLPSPLFAQDYDWASGVSGTWGSPVFWNPSTGFPNGAGDPATISVDAAFGNQSYYVVLSGNYSVDAFPHVSGAASFQVSNRTFTVTGSSIFPVVVDHSGTLSVGAGSFFSLTGVTTASQFIVQPGSTFIPGDSTNITLASVITNTALGLDTSDLVLGRAAISGSGSVSTLAGSNVDIRSSNVNTTLSTGGTTTITLGESGNFQQFNNSGTIAIATGESTGILTFSQGFTCTPDSKFEIEIEIRITNPAWVTDPRRFFRLAFSLTAP